MGDTSETRTSTTLIRAAQQQDNAAWRRLVETYSRRMYRWCRQAGLQPEDAQNVVQEAFTSLVGALPQFRRDRPGDTFRGWLRRITDNKIRDHYRRRGREPVAPPLGGSDAQALWAATPDGRSAVLHEPDEPTWDTTLVPKAEDRHARLAQIVEEVRSQVSPRDWRFFWRIAVDGQSAADVAREYGVSANAVRLVKMRVLRRLHAVARERG